jgi:hypothetical protein
MFQAWKQSLYKLLCIGFVLVPALLSGSALYAQDGYLYLPLPSFGNANQVGVALSNPTIWDADLELTFLTEKGALLTGPQISNPVELSVPSNGQTARLLQELFGPGIAGKRGWIEIYSSEAGVSGIYVLMDSGLRAVDSGLLTHQGVARLVFPRVTGDTTLAFVNVYDALVRAEVRFFDTQGRFVTSTSLELDAYHSIVRTPADFLTFLANFNGSVTIEATEVLDDEVLPADALVGVEAYKKGSDIAVITAVPLDSAARQGYIPHFATGSGYSTRVFIVNASDESQTVRLTLQADSESRSKEITQTIPAHARFDQPVDQAFGLASDTFTSGHLKLENTGTGKGVLAFVEISTLQGLVSTVTAESRPLSDYIFSHVAQNDAFYTGTVLLNPGTVPTHIAIDVFDGDAELVGSRSFSLLPGKRIAQVLDEWIPEAKEISTGYVHITATEPVLAMQLFGSRQGIPFLANVPATAVALEPQSSGTIVNSEKGAIVISHDGAARVSIPPRAMDFEEEIRISMPDLKTLPAPGPATTAVAAVQLTPVGTPFNVPARLTFNLSAYFEPGTRLSLLVWDPENNDYLDPDVTALVDDSGLTASVDVRELDTYVVELRNVERLSVDSLSPDRGIGGTRVTILGSTFSVEPSNNIVTFAGPDHTAVRAQVTAASTTSLTVLVPEGAVTGPVVVRTGSKTSARLQFTVLYNSPRPSLISTSPAFALQETLWIEVRLAGTGFTRNTRVFFDGSPVDSRYIDSTHIAVVLREPQLMTGNHRFTVENPAPGGGTSDPIGFQVRYPTASITELIPDTGLTFEVNSVTIVGTGFTPFSSVRMGVQPVGVIFIDSETLEVLIYSTTPGPAILKVSNPSPTGDDGSLGLFTFEDP